MKYHNCYLICFAVWHVLPVINAVEKSEFFKVPHDPNKHLNTDRAPRIIDDKSDPDMVQLKALQETFFGIIANTSLGTEFNGFTDILSLVDSGVARQLGIIIGAGFKIGFGKQNSWRILVEFWDEFQYRLPHGLSEALTDYTDFAKSVDISLLPMTIDLLFQKDHLGNSLAQMPIGQLVDLVQPEASKYGIDIRSFINGILGKGDSIFPELVRSTMQNLNFKTLLETVVNFIPKELNTDNNGLPSQKGDTSVVTKSERVEKTVKLFKPLIAILLKKNQIDLDVDAVIQVLIPFVGAGGEYISQLFEGGSSGLNLGMLGPFLAMMNTGSGKESNPLSLFASLFANSDLKSGNSMSNILNIASQLMGNKNKPDNSKKKDAGGIDVGNLLQMASQLSGTGGLDANSLLNTAASFFSNNKDESNGSGDVMGIIGKLSKGENIDPGQLLQTAASLMKNLQPSNNENDQNESKKTESKEKAPESDQNESKKKESQEKTPENIKPKENDKFFNLLKPMIVTIKTDEKIQNKIRSGIKQMKKMLKSNKISSNNIENSILSISGMTKLPDSLDIEVLNTMFSFSYKEWRTLLSQLGNDTMRRNLISQTLSPAAQLVSMFASDDFDKQGYILFHELSLKLEMYGIRGLTFDNIYEKFQPTLELFAMFYEIPVDIKQLLQTLKTLIRDLSTWRKQTTQNIRSIPKQDLPNIVSTYLEKDIMLPLFEIWKIYDRSIETPEFLPKEICNLITKMETDDSNAQLKLAFIRIMSFGLGMNVAYQTNDFEVIGDIMLASLSKMDDCEANFPVQYAQIDEEPEKKEQNYHAQMREDL